MERHYSTTRIIGEKEVIKAEIIKDSISLSGSRITTFALTYPRFIHSEFMTHRMISKNASSSRAIPVATFMKSITENPAMPIAFSKNCKGMQAKEEIQNQNEAIDVWLDARNAMIEFVQKLSDLGVHKQHANRLLEPFTHITVVATATDWSNFFALRTHKDAQPEFQVLAKLMWDEFSKNEPSVLEDGEWHLPFITQSEESTLKNILAFTGLNSEYRSLSRELLKRSVARCARVSYNTLDGSENSIQKDIELYDRLVVQQPLHASPTEHQAMAVADSNYKSGNLTGWIQYRKTLTNENIVKFEGYDSEDK
jgi:thymidylate synthase ThyX